MTESHVAGSFVRCVCRHGVGFALLLAVICDYGKEVTARENDSIRSSLRKYKRRQWKRNKRYCQEMKLSSV